MKFIYEGTDIASSVDLIECVHDMHAAGRADILRITIDDTKKKWDGWGAKEGDRLRVISDSVDTGTMFVSSLSFGDGILRLTASSAPSSMYEHKSKTWNEVTFLRMTRDIAQSHGLRMKTYFVEDRKYKIIQQEESDAAFLDKRCRLEGCAFLVFDETLVIYGEEETEAQEPGKTITLSDGETFHIKEKRAFGSCEFWCGAYKGYYKERDGPIFVPGFSFETSGEAEANRFAKNLLRFKNKKSRTGHKKLDEIEKAYAPGTVVTLQSQQAKSWNGPAFIDHVRNDYVNKKSKVFFRKIGGGKQ